jgi:NTP pyrophosphatase (non-canonical NTP hydrolase)
MTYGIDELAFQIHNNAIDKGFWEANNGLIFYMKQIAMIHSEATEALEAMRKEEGSDTVVKELADIIIRTLDLWGGLVRDGYTKKSIEESLVEKVNYNTQRERMHGVLA